MIKWTNVNIALKDNTTSDYFFFPVIPEKINFESGDAIVTTVNILKVGAVDFPNGVDVNAVSFQSFFPARYDAAYCKFSNLKQPYEYRDQLDAWKEKGTSLQLIIPAAHINKTVYISSFKGSMEGFECDIPFSITFKDLKDIRPIQIKTASVTAPTPTATPASRPPAPPQPAYWQPNATTKGVTTWLWVRTGPGTSNGTIGKLYPNEKFMILSDAGGGWYKVRFQNASGGISEGYSAAGYMKSL